MMIILLQSTLLNKVTATHSESASYEFTTLTCIPGVINVSSRYISLIKIEITLYLNYEVGNSGQPFWSHSGTCKFF